MARLTLVSEGSGSLSELQPAHRYRHLRCCSYLGCRYQRKGGSRNDTHWLIMGYIWSSSILHCKWCSHGTSDVIRQRRRNEHLLSTVFPYMHNCKAQPCGGWKVLLWCFSYTGMHKTLFVEICLVCAICILISLAKWPFTCGSVHVSWHQTMVHFVNCAGNASISWRVRSSRTCEVSLMSSQKCKENLRLFFL